MADAVVSTWRVVPRALYVDRMTSAVEADPRLGVAKDDAVEAVTGTVAPSSRFNESVVLAQQDRNAEPASRAKPALACPVLPSPKTALAISNAGVPSWVWPRA
jgi:hypothetical protein